MTRHLAAALVAAIGLCAALPAPAGDDAALLEQARALFAPLPADAGTAQYPVTPERVRLGRMLFFESRIATDGIMSCAACHKPGMYFTDGLVKSIGNTGRPLPRNAPTVLNTALQFVQHYGGNRKTVEEQAQRALVSSLAYGNASYDAAMDRLKAIPGYAQAFAAAFPGQAQPVTAENFGLAVGAYERTLMTPAPFDRFLQGDTSALSTQARAGLKQFIETGCAGCHGGVVVGGQMYQKFGVVEPYWAATGSAPIDAGRYLDTKDAADTFLFKVPQLRNVAVTGPYFHDGSAATLAQAVKVMGRVQLGRKLADAEVADIIAFLESLTGTLPASLLEAPLLPPNAR